MNENQQEHDEMDNPSFSLGSHSKFHQFGPLSILTEKLTQCFNF